MSYLIKPHPKIQGTLGLPGDKSISHRAIIISSLAKGKTKIKNFSFSDDCIATLKAFKSLGVQIKSDAKKSIIVFGAGIDGLKKPKNKIDLSESGTSMRILTGLLSGQNFATRLDAQKSLRNRPMLRVIKPLRLMGANIKSRVKGKDEYPPITIMSARLKPIKWKMDVASAQVKSAILLAGLYAKGRTKIYEPVKSRDHTERMLKYFKGNISVKGKSIAISPSNLISPKEIHIPADISSASFFIVLACLLRNSCIRIKDVCLNPTRTGVIEVLKKMGAKINIQHRSEGNFEPVADVVVKSSKLKPVKVGKNKIPSLIDELPILMVAASLSKGKSIFEGIGELKMKETDRIKSMVWNLTRMGVKVERKIRNNKETVLINGTNRIKGATLRSFGDHRTAMSMIVAALCADSPSRIDNIKCIDKSFPEFLKFLRKLSE